MRAALAFLCLSLGFLAGVACQPAPSAADDPSRSAPEAAPSSPESTARPAAPSAAAPADGDTIAPFVAALSGVLEARLRAGDANVLKPETWCPLDAATTALDDPQRFLARDVLQILRDELTAKHKLSNHEDFEVPRHAACTPG